MATTLTESAFTGLSWNPVHDVHELFVFPFMQHALAAGTIVAVMAGAVGWLMVLRRQTFAGHTLSVTAFTGASAAAYAGIPLAAGYYGICVLGAAALAGTAGTRRSLSAESAATGSVQALALALGFPFLNPFPRPPPGARRARATTARVTRGQRGAGVMRKRGRGGRRSRKGCVRRTSAAGGP